MLLNIIVDIGVQLLFSIRTNRQPEAQMRCIELTATQAGKKEI